MDRNGLKTTIAGSAFLISGSILLGSAYQGNTGNDFVGILGLVFGILGILMIGYCMFYSGRDESEDDEVL